MKLLIKLLNEWQAEGGLAYEWDDPCSPELLSKVISPWLTDGAIEFAAFVQQGDELSFSRLLVRSDGFVETYWHRSKGSKCGVSEIFVPRGPRSLPGSLEPYL